MNKTKYTFEPGAIIKSNSCGNFIFLEEIQPKNINGKLVRFGKVQFIETGTIREARILSIAAGKVKDPYYRCVAGVGYLGESANMQYSKKEYDMWRHMILRCYDPKSKEYNNYGGIGITVCERWHSFENFLNDLPSLPGYTKYKYSTASNTNYQLDKDFLQQSIPENQKVYSPQTCILLEINTNSRLGGYAKKQQTTSEYHGVYRLSNGNFQCRVMINGIDYFLGTYDDEIAAANMYNYAIVGVDSMLDINDVPFMSIAECLEHKTRNQAIKIPPNMRSKELEEYNLNANLKGVSKRDNYYRAQCFNNNEQIVIGKFTDKIAAANAYNYYVTHYGDPSTHVLNDVPYMPPSEWIKHKYYGKNDIRLIQMTQATNESDEDRKARCLAKYGIEFL